MTFPNLRRLRLSESVSVPSRSQEVSRAAFLSRSTYLEIVVLNFTTTYGSPLATFQFEDLTLKNLRSFSVGPCNGSAIYTPYSGRSTDSFRAFIQRHPKLAHLSLAAPFVPTGIVFTLNDLKKINALRLPVPALNFETMPVPPQLQVLSISIGYYQLLLSDLPTRLRPVSLHLRCLHMDLLSLPTNQQELVSFLRETVLGLQVMEEIGISVRSGQWGPMSATILVRNLICTEDLIVF